MRTERQWHAAWWISTYVRKYIYTTYIHIITTLWIICSLSELDIFILMNASSYIQGHKLIRTGHVVRGREGGHWGCLRRGGDPAVQDSDNLCWCVPRQSPQLLWGRVFIIHTPGMPPALPIMNTCTHSAPQGVLSLWVVTGGCVCVVCVLWWVSVVVLNLLPHQNLSSSVLCVVLLLYWKDTPLILPQLDCRISRCFYFSFHQSQVQ